MGDDIPLNRRTFLKTTGATGAVAAASGLASATPGRSPGPKKDEILVGVAANEDDIEGRVRQYVPGNAEIVHSNETLSYVAVTFPSAASDTARKNFVAAVTDDERVKYAEENATVHAQYAPNDPREPDQCALDQINARAAWDTTLGSSGVTVGILDTGVEYSHPELDGNFASNPGKDFVDTGTDPFPDTCSEDHGTRIAGIIAAETDNGSCVAGVSQSTLLAGRVLDENGSGSISDIADGIEWAADQGVDILNLSLGGGGYSSTMKNAVSYASNNGVLQIAAAGGSAGSVSYPAAYSECMAVSAVDCNDNLASFTNTGSQIEIAGPGVDLLTLDRTCQNGCASPYSGTSFAAAYVSGVAALALSEWSSLSNSGLRSHLKSTARSVGLSSNKVGSGVADAAAAVTTAPSGSSTSSSISDSLSGYTDSDCWTYAWSYSNPSKVVVELSGPSSADFDLYVDEGATTCPTTSTYDYRSYSTNSQETITVQNPNDSTDLQILVDSYTGSGNYTLTITEFK
jgi:serine protease